MAAASETSRRITKFYKNAQGQKWTTFLVVKCAEVKVLAEINVYFEVDRTFRYFFVIVWNSSRITTIWNNLKNRLFDVTILNILISAINMMFIRNLVRLCNWLYQLFRYIVIPWNGLICFIGGNQIEGSQQLAYLLYWLGLFARNQIECTSRANILEC